MVHFQDCIALNASSQNSGTDNSWKGWTHKKSHIHLWQVKCDRGTFCEIIFKKIQNF